MYLHGAEDAWLETSVERVWKTMSIVEACYASAQRGFEPIATMEA